MKKYLNFSIREINFQYLLELLNKVMKDNQVNNWRINWIKTNKGNFQMELENDEK